MTPRSRFTRSFSSAACRCVADRFRATRAWRHRRVVIAAVRDPRCGDGVGGVTEQLLELGAHLVGASCRAAGRR